MTSGEPGGAAGLDYPAAWEADVVLRDGHTVRVRPIVAADAAALGAFHDRQSPESVYFRFLSPRPRLSDKELRHFTELDYRDRMAFVAELDDEIVAVARYERYKGTDTAEVAFFVDDDHHGRGLATLMLEYLAAAARHRGLRRFTASTLPSNRKMLDVFATAGFSVSSRLEDGVVVLSFGIEPTDESTAAVDRRERQAEAATVERLLRPRSVAVIGTSSPLGLGAALVDAILAGDFTGSLCMVGTDGPPDATEVPVCDEIPHGTDLAVIAVTAHEVPAVVERCARADVGAILIHSAGFSELSSEGALMEQQVVETARRHGVRVLGPNGLGLVNTDPGIRLHATVASGRPPAGSVAVFAQSGTLAAAVLQEAERTRLGVSTFVAGGNHADVGVSDMLSFWSEDDRTGAVLLYMRSAGLPSRLVRAVRSTSLRKPVAILGQVFFGGAEDAGAADRRIAALGRQTGVISAGTLEQLLDIGRLVEHQPVPAGPGVAVVGNSDGAVRIAADACRGTGLELAALDGASGGRQNPVNLTYRATAQDYAKALAGVSELPGVHSVLVVHTPPRMRESPDVFDAIVEASAAAPDVAFAATVLGAVDTPLLGVDHHVPTYTFPEHAAMALGRLATYRQWTQATPELGGDPPMGCDLDGARAVVDGALSRRGRAPSVVLDLAEQERLLEAFAVQVARREVVGGPDEAMAAVDRIGWPVAIKAARRDRRTRSAESGVAIDIADEADLRATWERMERALGDDIHPVAVQRFIERGVDAAVVLRRTATGTTVEVGLGGPVTAFDERQLGLLPLTLTDAQSLVGASALGRALQDPLERVAVVGVVQRMAEMVEQVEEIQTVVADPVVASVEGAWVADVSIEVGPPGETLPVRRLD